MRFCRTGIIFLICLVSSISDTNARIYRRKYCHFNEILRCWEPLRYFSARVNGTGIVLNDNEMDWWCGQQQIFFKRCTDKFFKRCSNPMHREIYESFVVKPMLETIDEFCDPNQSFRKIFLEQSPCLHNKVKQLPEYRLKCVKQLQTGFEWMQENTYNNLTQQFHSFCCVFNRWEKCITDFLIEKCGPQQDQSIRLLISSATGFFVHDFCQSHRFHPETELCVKYFEPKNVMPKGLRSNSFLSWSFSYLCPNIGYGIRENDV